MENMTISFPIAALGARVNKGEIYKELYKEIRAHVKEEDVVGVQIYPADWPRKVQITLRDKEVKEKLVIEGLDIFCKHVDLKDESSTLHRVVVKDAPMEWDDAKLSDIFDNYGKVV